MKTFLAQTADQWRAWLDAHHESESEIWLIFHKKHTGVVSITPAYIQTALRKHPAASRHFEVLTPSHRRRYFAWIDSAKREDTKLRRLKEAIRLLTKGKVLGLK